MQCKLICLVALVFGLLNASHAVELNPQRPSIPITIDIAKRPTARVDTTLIQYGTYNFVVSFKYDGVPIDLTDATATYINAKLTTDALAGTGDLIFNDSGVIDSEPGGIVSFPVRAGYLDAANARVRFEFRVYRQESSVPDESVDIRSYVDLYVMRSTLTGAEDPWTAPSPVESYYTKTEVNSILTNNVTSVKSPTWSDSYDVTAYNLSAETISGIQDPGAYIQFGNDGVSGWATNDIHVAANDFVVTAGGDAVLSSAGDIYLDAGTIYFHEPGGTGSSMGFDGTTMSVSGRFQIVDDTHAAITELSETSYGTLLWDGAVETVYAPYLHGTAAEALESLHFGYGLNSATGRGGMRYVYYLPTSMPTIENTLTIGSATVENFARINTSLMPIVFGGETPTNYDIATSAGEVLFSEDVVFIAEASFLGDLRLNGGVMYDSVGNVLIEDGVEVNAAQALIELNSTTTAPKISFSLADVAAGEIGRDATENSMYLKSPGAVSDSIISLSGTDEQVIISANGGSSAITVGADAIGTGFDGVKITGDVTTTGHVGAGTDLSVTGSASVGGDLAVGTGSDIVADGKAAVVTARSTSEMSIVDYGLASMSAGTSTVTFNVAFAHAPTVVASYSSPTQPATPLYVGTINTTGATIKGDTSGSYNIHWIAIGQK